MAKEISINFAKKLENGEEFSGTVTMNAPEDFSELASMWGEAVGYNKAMAQIIIDARRLCYEADSVEQAQEMVNNFTPGVTRQRSTSGISKKAFLEMLKGYSKEEVEQAFANLKSKSA